MLWDLTPGSSSPDEPVEALASRACQIANRNLSEEEWQQLIGPDSPYRETCPDLGAIATPEGDSDLPSPELVPATPMEDVQ